MSNQEAWMMVNRRQASYARSEDTSVGDPEATRDETAEIVPAPLTFSLETSDEACLVAKGDSATVVSSSEGVADGDTVVLVSNRTVDEEETNVVNDDKENASIVSLSSGSVAVPEGNQRGSVVETTVESSSRQYLSNSSTSTTHATLLMTEEERGSFPDFSTQASPSEDGCKNESLIPFISRRRLALFSAMLIATCVVVVVAVVVPLISMGGQKYHAPPMTPTTTTVSQVRALVLQQNWSDPLSLLDPMSPQYKAVEQLARMEGVLLEDMERLQQRYAVLVVWYGLGGGGSENVHLQECEWKGLVQCDSESNVVGLTMESKALDGTILEEIGMLSHLGECSSVLNVMQYCRIIRHTTFFHIYHIVHFDVYQNNIRGSLPPALYSLTKLSKFQSASRTLCCNHSAYCHYT